MNNKRKGPWNFSFLFQIRRCHFSDIACLSSRTGEPVYVVLPTDADCVSVVFLFVSQVFSRPLARGPAALSAPVQGFGGLLRPALRRAPGAGGILVASPLYGDAASIPLALGVLWGAGAARKRGSGGGAGDLRLKIAGAAGLERSDPKARRRRKIFRDLS